MNRAITILFSLVGILIFSNVLQAQDDAAPDQFIYNYLERDYPGADSVVWMKIPQTDMVRITFKHEEEDHYVIVNDEGAKYESGELISERELPEVVWESFLETDYGGYDVLGIYDSETPRKEDVFRFDLRSMESETVTLYLDSFGRTINLPHNPHDPLNK